jgi:hypothetical protein
MFQVLNKVTGGKPRATYPPELRRPPGYFESPVTDMEGRA